MKILVTGVKGQLGFDVVNEAEKRGIEAVGVDIDEMDVTNKEQVEQVIKAGNYDAVVHCAAWTAVDKGEEPELFEKVRAGQRVGKQNTSTTYAKSWIFQLCISRPITYSMEKGKRLGTNTMNLSL